MGVLIASFLVKLFFTQDVTIRFHLRNTVVKAVRTKMTEREVQSQGRKEAAPLGEGKQLMVPRPLPPALLPQRRTRG